MVLLKHVIIWSRVHCCVDESNGFRHCHPCARKVTSFSRALASLRSPVYWGLVVVSIPGMAFDAL